MHPLQEEAELEARHAVKAPLAPGWQVRPGIPGRTLTLCAFDHMEKI